MSRTVLDEVQEALDASNLSDDEQLYVLAACTGELNDVLDGADLTAIRKRVGVTDLQGASPAWLESIAVSGFRGIATGDPLTLEPGPGLTLVVGRNGCGKSSYVEALEVALSGDSVRWKDRKHPDWKKGWANLHYSSTKPVRIAISLTREGTGSVTVNRTWTSTSATLEDSTVSVSSGSLADAGWDAAVEATPPILSYSELGKIAEARPIDLFSPLYKLLGLERISEASEALAAARKPPEQAVKTWKATAKSLHADLANVDDPRAARCHKALADVRAAGGQWDRAAIEDVLLAKVGEDDGLADLKALSTVRIPAADAVKQAVTALALAMAHSASLTSTNVHRVHQIANLLDSALKTDLDPDDPCPVCGTAEVFGPEWKANATAQLAELRAETKQARDAEHALSNARSAIRRLIVAPRAPIAKAAALGLPDIQPAIDTFVAFATGTDAALVADLIDAHALLSEAVEGLNATATEQLTARRDLWRPFHLRLAAWIEGTDRAVESEIQVRRLRRARDFLTELARTLRVTRFQPIADQAKRVWEQLRQSSNVSLDAITLGGTGKRGSLELTTRVDGADAPAFGVMSQGELNALGLALFLPRATSDESPFRFVVIDDPVQAMDSHKVDGLALLLADLAKERQVVVFTHDARLQEAVRRMQIPARVLEVQRGDQSKVRIHVAKDPVQRYLDDAFKAANEQTALGNAVSGVLVAGHCRAALEAASVTAFRRRRLKTGAAHTAVVDAINDAHGLQAIVCLAKYDNTHQAGNIFPALNNRGKRYADAFRALKEGAHGDLSAYPYGLVDLIKDTGDLCDWVS